MPFISSSWVIEIVDAGSNTDQTKRIKGNLKNTDNQLPVISGTHKDHKKVTNPIEGSDLRPIMGATVGPNVAITNFIAKNVVKKVAEAASTGNDCKNTEELLNKFEDYNKSRVLRGFPDKNIFVASMDINKWFPSMKLKPMTEEVEEMIVESNINFKEINYDRIAKYLGKHIMTIEEILEEDMDELLYIEETKMNETKYKKFENKKNANNVNMNEIVEGKNKTHGNNMEKITNNVNMNINS